jgi:hypothetical protein
MTTFNDHGRVSCSAVRAFQSGCDGVYRLFCRGSAMQAPT